MKVEILSPEKSLFAGEVELIMLPGTSGMFTILDRHAPMISSLEKGEIMYRIDGKDICLKIQGGFVEIKKNVITVCVE